MADRILMFWKYPARGRVKTRLIPALGVEGATSLQLAMARHALGWARSAAARRGAALEVCFTGGPRQAMARLIDDGVELRDQGDGDLGARLGRAFDAAFTEGARRVVVIGADCPDATDEVIIRAFAALDEHDAVIGPAADGGYYLLGLGRWIGAVFDDVPWSTAQVLAVTRSRLAAAGASCLELEQLEDVDRPSDLPVWEAARRRPPPG